MLSIRNKVNSRLSLKLKNEDGAPYHDKPLNFSAGASNTPTAFPTLDVNSLGEVDTADDLSMNAQNAIISTIEVKAYTNTRLTDARTILDHSGDVMRSMKYSMIFGPQVLSDVNPYCVVARFRRTFGSNDTL